MESTEDSNDALERRYAYYDPIDTPPVSGQEWWRRAARVPEPAATVAA